MSTLHDTTPPDLSQLFQPIDLLKAFTDKPPDLDFIWPGFLAGTVGALYAPGATGKSFWALEAAMSIACHVCGGDLVRLNPGKTGQVIYLAGEDPNPALVKRVHSIGDLMPPEAHKAIAENLTLVSIMGKRLDVMNDKHLTELIKQYAGSRLIVADTLSRIHQLDENNNGDMARLVSALEYLSVETGAAVLFLHHASKSSARDGQLDQQQAARGASALIDNARWAGFVAKMSEEESGRMSCFMISGQQQPIGERRKFYLRFGISKQNYSEPFDDKWLERSDGGVLIPARLEQNDNKKNLGGRNEL
jgi:RecA-family ATPase